MVFWRSGELGVVVSYEKTIGKYFANISKDIVKHLLFLVEGIMYVVEQPVF